MNMGKRFTDGSMAKISSLENRLSGALKPVAPRKEFIYGLGQRFQTVTRPTFVDRVANWHLYALMVAALVSVAVFAGMLVRALVDAVAKKRAARIA